MQRICFCITDGKGDKERGSKRKKTTHALQKGTKNCFMTKDLDQFLQKIKTRQYSDWLRPKYYIAIVMDDFFKLRVNSYGQQNSI